MTEDFDKMARIEREIEKRMESACEKDGWARAAAITTVFCPGFTVPRSVSAGSGCWRTRCRRSPMT